MEHEQLILEVSQVNSYIKEMLDTDGLLGGLCIRGELSNYKKYPSGHHYFTLKDGQSQLKCVMFRSSAMRLRFVSSAASPCPRRGQGICRWRSSS